MRGPDADAVVAVRFCRHCGKPTAMEPDVNDETRPFVCRADLGDVLAGPAPPWWAEGADARLSAASL